MPNHPHKTTANSPTRISVPVRFAPYQSLLHPATTRSTAPLSSGSDTMRAVLVRLRWRSCARGRLSAPISSHTIKLTVRWSQAPITLGQCPRVSARSIPVITFPHLTDAEKVRQPPKRAIGAIRSSKFRVRSSENLELQTSNPSLVPPVSHVSRVRRHGAWRWQIFQHPG